MTQISQDLIKIALERVEGNGFERFSQQFLSALLGHDFVPLGGMHDGGADGFSGDMLYENSGGKSYMQASIRADYSQKIRETIKRIRDVKRDIRTLYHMTPKVVPKIDIAEDALSEELGCTIKIRDFHYIVNHINDSNGCIAAYREHLERYTTFLKQVGASRLLSPSPEIEDPSAYVFLEQEVGNRFGNTTLIQTITDSLILWALNGTDPDQGRFMSRQAILDKITSTLPWAKQFIKGHIDQRLESLANKANPSGREVRWHKKENGFCLPFETRQLVQHENAVDESLRIDVRNEIIESLGEGCDLGMAELVANVALRTTELFFEREGLAMAYFVSGKDQQASVPNTVSDRIEESLTQTAVPPKDVTIVRELARETLRKMFYFSSPKQRELLFALSRTYVLLFTLKAEPRVIEYFQNMTNRFRLYVGTDVLLLALTERYIPDEDRRARNMLRLARSVGASLYLPEPILEELHTHICATDFEFRNHYAEIEPYVDAFLASQSDRILIRTYFYAKNSGKAAGWKKFINQFAPWDKLHSPAGKEELRSYLVSEFGLEFVSKDELLSVCNADRVGELVRSLIDNKVKDREELALNDSIMIHSVYGLRRKNRETQHGPLEFGYLTWWLTHETHIQQYTAQLVVENAGARYIMRPEFLLNYFALCPSREEVLTTYRNIFPSTLGLQMGHRLREDSLHSILDIVGEWKDLEPGRRAAKMKSLSDRLKTDILRIHDFRLEPYEQLRK